MWEMSTHTPRLLAVPVSASTLGAASAEAAPWAGRGGGGAESPAAGPKPYNDKNWTRLRFICAVFLLYIFTGHKTASG